MGVSLFAINLYVVCLLWAYSIDGDAMRWREVTRYTAIALEPNHPGIEMRGPSEKDGDTEDLGDEGEEDLEGYAIGEYDEGEKRKGKLNFEEEDN